MASPESFRRLKEEAGKLDGLYQDVYAPVFARQDWKGTVFARRTLGDKVPVEAWYLAEYFLLAWNDWHGLRGRYLAYFGQPPTRFPRSWNTLHTRCKGLAEQILRDGRLDEIIHDSWFTVPAWNSLLRKDNEPSSRSVYHAIITNHRRLALLQTASTWEDGDPDEPEKMVPRSAIWPRSLQVALELNGHLLSLWNELPRQVRESCLWHLRHYRRANLLVSWLVNTAAPGTEEDGSSMYRAGDGRGDGVGGDGRGGGVGGGWRPVPDIVHRRSALLQVLSERIVIPSIEQYLSQFQDANLRRTASHVLNQISQAIGEIGYDEFVEDVSSSDFCSGPESLVGTSEISLIPSKAPSRCQPMLLAVSKGDKKAIGFPSIMRQVREHLIRCQGTLSVVVLCDHWGADMLEEHLKDLRAHHDRGVRFLFLMVGTPNRVVGPVAVDLAAVP